MKHQGTKIVVVCAAICTALKFGNVDKPLIGGGKLLLGGIQRQIFVAQHVGQCVLGYVVKKQLHGIARGCEVGARNHDFVAKYGEAVLVEAKKAAEGGAFGARGVAH